MFWNKPLPQQQVIVLELKLPPALAQFGWGGGFESELLLIYIPPSGMANRMGPGQLQQMLHWAWHPGNCRQKGVPSLLVDL